MKIAHAGREPMVLIVAPSAPVPPIELAEGVKKIRSMGFHVKVHAQCERQWMFYAGTDAQRLKAFTDAAYNSTSQVIWCARGGSGAVRLLPGLLEYTKKFGKPKHRKVLVGYSDACALMNFAAKNWGFEVIHASMPGQAEFVGLSDSECDLLRAWIKIALKVSQPRFEYQRQLKILAGRMPKKPVIGTLVGGNLTTLAGLVGTPFEVNTRNSILFLEDVGEAVYRLDRMLQQWLLSGVWRKSKLKAIVLGNFLNCRDAVPEVRSDKAGSCQKLRPEVTLSEALMMTFKQVSRELSIPVFQGLPSGHGPGHLPLYLNTKVGINSKGVLSWRFKA